MLAVVKKPRTNKTLFKVKGDIPSEVIEYLEREFGQDVEVVKDDEELLNIFDTRRISDQRVGNVSKYRFIDKALASWAEYCYIINKL